MLPWLKPLTIRGYKWRFQLLMYTSFPSSPPLNWSQIIRIASGQEESAHPHGCVKHTLCGRCERVVTWFLVRETGPSLGMNENEAQHVQRHQILKEARHWECNLGTEWCKQGCLLHLVPPAHMGVFSGVYFKKMQSPGRAAMQIRIKMSALEFVLAGDLPRWEDMVVVPCADCQCFSWILSG